MSVTIRLTRHGTKKKPYYRIVVSDRRFPRDGRYIEQVGTYDPNATSGGVKLNREKVETWIKQGAKPSQTVSELIKREKKASYARSHWNFHEGISSVPGKIIGKPSRGCRGQRDRSRGRFGLGVESG